MNLPLLIARRMRMKPEDSTTRSPGIAIATAGVAIATVVMLMSIAIVTGFKHKIRAKISGFDSQVTVLPVPEPAMGPDDIPTLTISPEVESILADELPQGTRYRLELSRPGILKTDDSFAGVLMTGADDKQHSFIAENIVEGTYPDDPAKARDAIVLSRMTASSLGLSCGDKVTVHFIIDGRIRSRRLKVAAIYDTHFAEYDSRYAYTSLPLLQGISHMEENTGTSIAIDGIDPSLTADVAARLTERFNRSASLGEMPLLQAASVEQLGAMYFSWLDLLDTNVTVILTLMSLVAGFTLVSSTFIIILERVRMIGILKAMGMTDSRIRRIFIYAGMRLVAVGLVIGNALGLGLLMIQQRFNLIPLDPEAYYLDYVPVEINWWAVLLLNAAIVVAAALVLVIPTRTICSMRPAESIKFE